MSTPFPSEEILAAFLPPQSLAPLERDMEVERVRDRVALRITGPRGGVHAALTMTPQWARKMAGDLMAAAAQAEAHTAWPSGLVSFDACWISD